MGYEAELDVGDGTPILEMTRAWGKMLCLSHRKWLVTKKIIGSLQA